MTKKTSSIETVPLHRFMRGMNRGMYKQSFVMIGNDLLRDNNDTDA